MVKIMETLFEMDDLGGNPPIFGNIQLMESKFFSKNPCSLLFESTWGIGF